MQHGGGFASVRSSPLPLGVPQAQACVIEVRGDGKRYKLNLRTDDAFDGIHHQTVFDPPAGTWATLHLPLSAFAASWRGRPVPDAAPLDPAQLRQIGLMTADHQAGPFAVALRAIGLA